MLIGNLPAKECRKREHPPDDEKSEKLAKITVKFSKEGGHPHIVQQTEQENHQKRPHDEPNHVEKTKKQKVEVEPTPTMSTRSKQKEQAIEASPSDSKKNNLSSPAVHDSVAVHDNPGHGSRGKHKDSSTNSPIEAKRSKLKETRHKNNPIEAETVEKDVPVDVAGGGVASVAASPAGSLEESTPAATPLVTPASTPEVPNPGSETLNTPTPPAMPKKRGRPRKVSRQNCFKMLFILFTSV